MRPILPPMARGLSAALALGMLIGFVPQTTRADTAFLVANARYSTAQNLTEARQIADLAAPLRAAGFDVMLVENGSAAELREGLVQLQNADERDRIVVAMTGHFARSRTDIWLLGADTEIPSLASVGATGLSLTTVMEIASTAPGRAVVLLGLERRQIELGRGLAAGISGMEPPQGVSVFMGAPDRLAEFTTQSLLVPGTDLPAAVSGSDGVRAFGFLSSDVPFLAAVSAVQPEPQTRQPAPSQPDASQRDLWEAATELNTRAAYGAYLDRYPDGAFASDARARLQALRADPIARAEAAETALGLSQQQRQQVQRRLSILDFDTRGIDGIFGPGTRNAIAGWQTSRDLPSTGYLTALQLDALRNQADLRTAELEAEDRAYWQATGQGRTRDGLGRYLQRFPDGLFAEQAEARIADINAATRAEAAARDRAAWDAARSADTVHAYSAYLQQWETGGFTDQARARIQALQGGGGQDGFTPAQTATFEAREQRINLPPVTRSLIEQRLQALGLQPGRVDGRFDAETRRALRRYQRARGLDATGYLDQSSVVRLLAETMGGMLRIDGVIE